MRLKRSQTGQEKKAALRQDLGQALEPLPAGQPVCGAACPRPNAADCSRECPDIPRVLSSDPDAYPLEAGIAPLVFEFKRLGVFDPCWSCEGHSHDDGTLWKVPRVWFYAESVVHVRLLAECLQDMTIAGQLSVPWQVVVTFSDNDNAGTTFSLEPTRGEGAQNLAALQRDVQAIAANLNGSFATRARQLSKEIR